MWKLENVESDKISHNEVSLTRDESDGTAKKKRNRNSVAPNCLLSAIRTVDGSLWNRVSPFFLFFSFLLLHSFNSNHSVLVCFFFFLVFRRFHSVWSWLFSKVSIIIISIYLLRLKMCGNEQWVTILIANVSSMTLAN